MDPNTKHTGLHIYIYTNKNNNRCFIYNHAQALDVQRIKCRVNVENKYSVTAIKKREGFQCIFRHKCKQIGLFFHVRFSLDLCGIYGCRPT
jgi:HKD family nuclease